MAQRVWTRPGRPGRVINREHVIVDPAGAKDEPAERRRAGAVARLELAAVDGDHPVLIKAGPFYQRAEVGDDRGGPAGAVDDVAVVDEQPAGDDRVLAVQVDAGQKLPGRLRR